VGYKGSALPGLPFDDERGVVPNDGGRVLDAAGTPLPGLYTTGWIKRGPVGLIGHTKGDALETVGTIIADLDLLAAPAEPDTEAILEVLEGRGIRFTSWPGWLALDAHERTLGEVDESPVARERVKVVARDEQVDIARAEIFVA
jgi:ferredoxin--NADP+ reductase